MLFDCFGVYVCVGVADVVGDDASVVATVPVIVLVLVLVHASVP